jgi:DNA-binding NarL/FixJ family response regulator
VESTVAVINASRTTPSTVVGPDRFAQLLEQRRRATLLDQLTLREREVLGLMAEGLSDRGIAQMLYLSGRTVETHIRHIIAKLRLPESTLHNRRVQAVLTYVRASGAAASGSAAALISPRSQG